MLDTITVQALINRYPTVCGMTGTALAAGEQLRQFYKLGVSPIPPNTPNIREDESDRVYITAAAKNDAVVEHITTVHETGQPVLVGTRDVAESEELHERLVKAGVPAVVLNAKNDAEEAARHRRGRHAARRSPCPPRWRAAAPTSASAAPTRRDHDEVAELGGLHVIGTGTAPHRAARQPAARPRRPPGRPRLVGVLLQLGGRRRRRPPGTAEAADADRRGRPDHQRQGGAAARARAAHRRGQAARRARQHVALQPAGRPAARDHRRPPGHAAAHRDGARGAGRALAQALRGTGRARSARSGWRRSAG